MGAHLMRGENVDDVYYAHLKSPSQLNLTTIFFSLHWHHKLSHPSIKVFKYLAQGLCISSKELSSFHLHCDSCSINKSHILPFGTISFHATKPLKPVYFDL